MKAQKSAVLAIAVSLFSWALSQGATTTEGIVGISLSLGVILFYEYLQEKQVKNTYSDLVEEIGEENFKQIAEDLAGEIQRRSND